MMITTSTPEAPTGHARLAGLADISWREEATFIRTLLLSRQATTTHPKGSAVWSSCLPFHFCLSDERNKTRQGPRPDIKKPFGQ